MPHDPSQTQDPPQTGVPQKLSRIVLDDLNQMDFRRTMREDLQEIYQFYLDADTRDRLDEMDRFSRWCHLTGWLLKNSILKLPPVRRLLLIQGASAGQVSTVSFGEERPAAEGSSESAYAQNRRVEITYTN